MGPQRSQVRSLAEKVFLVFFIPSTILFYLIYKYPLVFVSEDKVAETFYWFGKSTSFWYGTLYTGLVCGISGWVLYRGKTPYGNDKARAISPYQRNKFLSIFISQLVFFYLIPFYLPTILSGKPFFGDLYSPANKNAYVYVYNGFTSIGGFAYIFIVVPLSVWFFGKRYCSWFCACGNLAEAVGVTKWGNRWVTEKTPRGAVAAKLEVIQYFVLAFAVVFGLVLFLHTWNVLMAPTWVESLREFQDLSIDLIFGALIGVGAYPFLGSRIWCRYGCPLAGGMRLVGKFTQSKFAVVANENCKGLNLCSTQCPMGIDVASYAHKNKIPTMGSFGLGNSPCIGCGGCIDICPVKALSFQKILNPEAI